MNILVVGAGAMGCLFGGELKEKGQEVVLVDVAPEQIQAINENGLIIERESAKRYVKIPAAYAHEINKPADLILVFTKTYHTERALASIKHLISGNTYILTLQNGLGNVEKISAYVDYAKIIVGMTNHPSDLIAPGHIRSTGSGHCKIMSAGGKSTAMLEKVCGALNEAGLDCEISSDVFSAIWEKVAFNSALNAIGAVTYLTNGGIASVPEGITLARNIAEEVVSVANKKGIQASRENVLAALDNALKNHPQHVCSMLQDILAERLTEIASLNGEVVRETKKIGMNAPVTETLYYLVRIQEQTYGKRVRPHV